MGFFFKFTTMKQAIGLLIIIICLASCKSINKKMDSWVGHHKYELYQKWGPPDRVTDDGLGGEILIYETWVSTGQTEGQITRSREGYSGEETYRYTAPQQNGYTRVRMFYVDQEGNIYSWRWQGL